MKAEAYALLCPRLPRGLRDEALEEAWAVANGSDARLYLPEAPALLGPVLPDETWKARATEAALKIADGPTRASTLGAQAPFLSEGLKARAMSGALEAVNGIQERRARLKADLAGGAHTAGRRADARRRARGARPAL